MSDHVRIMSSQCAPVFACDHSLGISYRAMNQSTSLTDRRVPADATPPLSVVMPAYNVEKFIGEAIESILNQSFGDFELIIVDDGSTDATLDVIRLYAKSDHRICFFSHARNLGPAAAFNSGLSSARGTYIARMDSDDIALPFRLEKQLNFLRSHPEVGIVGGAMILVDEANHPIGRRHYWPDDASIRRHIFFYSPFCGGSIMIRKNILESVGGYDVHCLLAEDYDLFFRLGMITRFANLHETVYRYRIRSESTFNRHVRRGEFDTVRLRRKYFRQYHAGILDRTYNLLHLLVLFILPSQWRFWLFLKVREILVPL